MKLNSLSHPEPHSTIPWVTWRKHVRHYKLMLSLDLPKASQTLLLVLRSHWWKLGALIWSRVFNSHSRIFNQTFIHQFIKIHFGPSDVNISYTKSTWWCRLHCGSRMTTLSPCTLAYLHSYIINESCTSTDLYRGIGRQCSRTIDGYHDNTSVLIEAVASKFKSNYYPCNCVCVCEETSGYICMQSLSPYCIPS